MNFLIDIGHPAHVHIFKNISKILISKGNSVFFTVREGEREADLLRANNLSFTVIGRKRKSFSGKLTGLFIFSYRILRLSQKHKSDLFLSHGSMYAGIASFFNGKPHIALEDTGNMEQLVFSKPFSNVILSPDSLRLNLGIKHLKYKGFHELFYLCSTCFTPDRNVKSLLGIERDEKYCLLRFISWGATHDHGHVGVNELEKRELINYLKGRYKIFISSESELPGELKQYKFPLSPEWLHHAISFSEIVITEGATIASESTLLGVPVVYINSRESDMIDEHEKCGLIFHFRNFKGVTDKISEILENPESRLKFINKRDEMFKTKIDVTSFFIWFVENYPESFQTMKDNPDYQDRFH
jgi:predicted glycosyltransferase